jgi:DNA primase catalytic subunit
LVCRFPHIEEKFNTQYSNLSEEQKGILKEYINNVSDTKQLKEFLNNKIDQVKEEIENLIPQIEDKVTTIKLNEVLNLIKPISSKQSIKDENLVSIMQYYELVKEIKSSLK